MSPAHEDERGRFLRFAAIGSLATLVHVLVFVLCVERLGLRPVAATVPAFTCAVLVSYFANRRWTFPVPGSHQSLLPKFVVVQLAGTVLACDDARFSLGDEVIAIGFDLGMNTWGGYSEIARIPASWAVKSNCRSVPTNGASRR